LLDLDADPSSVVEVLSKDPRLSRIVKKHPGLRAPGAVDGTELALQAILGQQVSLPAARTLASRLVTAKGDGIKIADPTLTHLFPGADAIAETDLSKLGIPATRRTTLHALAHAVAGGTLALDPGADRSETYQQLIRLPGIGEWTAGYIVMRALGDPDTFLGSDLGIKKAGARLGLGSNPRVMSEHAAAWRPWRSYATHQLWATLSDTPKEAS
jgi:AraC family transcriptional regulator of adaptative response / DNA-3-methyladenine glycosylase II